MSESKWPAAALTELLASEVATMPLAEHLHPKTYWEKRCALLEQSLARTLSLLANIALPPQAGDALREHMAEWNRLIGELSAEHPAPQEQANV